MRGSIKFFFQMGSNFANIFLVDKGIQIPLYAGPTLNAGFSGNPDKYC